MKVFLILSAACLLGACTSGYHSRESHVERRTVVPPVDQPAERRSSIRSEEDVKNDPNCEQVIDSEGHRRYRCKRSMRPAPAPVVEYRQPQQPTYYAAPRAEKRVKWFPYSVRKRPHTRSEIANAIAADDRTVLRVPAAELIAQIGQRTNVRWENTDAFLHWFTSEEVNESVCTPDKIAGLDMSRTDQKGTIYDFTFHRSGCYPKERIYEYNGIDFLSNVCLNVATDVRTPVPARP